MHIIWIHICIYIFFSSFLKNKHTLSLQVTFYFILYFIHFCLSILTGVKPCGMAGANLVVIRWLALRTGVCVSRAIDDLFKDRTFGSLTTRKLTFRHLDLDAIAQNISEWADSVKLSNWVIRLFQWHNTISNTAVHGESKAGGNEPTERIKINHTQGIG